MGLVLADPEGNEFCVLRSNAERAAFTRPNDVIAVYLVAGPAAATDWREWHNELIRCPVA